MGPLLEISLILQNTQITVVESSYSGLNLLRQTVYYCKEIHYIKNFLSTKNGDPLYQDSNVCTMYFAICYASHMKFLRISEKVEVVKTTVTDVTKEPYDTPIAGY